MPSQQRWAAMRFEVTAKVDGNEYEVIQVVQSFELNSIPTCSLTVAVGRNVRSLKAAAAHNHLASLKRRSFVEVYLKVIPLGSEGGAPNDWPDDKFPIFFGYSTGVGWSRSTSGANFVIHAEHWLSDLNYSSAVNGASHPGNPAAFTFPAGFRAAQLANAGASSSDVQNVTWLYHLRLDGGVDANQAKSDLWTNVIQKWMRQLAQNDPIDMRMQGLEQPQGNDGALEILDGTGQFKIVSEKMKLLIDGPDAESLGNSIARGLELMMMDNVINNTLWGKLVGELSPDYWFTVVPRVSDALIVPFVGALGPDKEFAEIKLGDYVQCDMQASAWQQLSCIGILHPIEWDAGGNTSPAGNQVELGGVSVVYPYPPEKKGMVMTKQAPTWLVDAMQYYSYAQVADGVQPRKAVGGPLADADVGEAQEPARNPADNMDGFRNVLYRYAQHWYVLEQLKGRTGELAGRLRFDIAPGSQVRVEAGTDKFLESDDLAVPFYASVSKVTNLINSEIQRAGTSFTLAHIRNEAENDDTDTSIDIPPLYEEAWTGKVLVDEIANL